MFERHNRYGAPVSSTESGTTGAPGKRTLTSSLPPVQRRADTGRAPAAEQRPVAPDAAVDPFAIHLQGASGAGSPLPAALEAKMGSAFDFDFGSVRVHEGGQAEAMGAVAYTEGTDLHFASGQYDPGSQRGQDLIGHELAHVVQQREGRVAATTQFKGVELNDDAGLEHEADDWGARAARGESVGRGGGGAAASAGPIQRKVVQRSAIATHAGKFNAKTYDKTKKGVEMELEFEPGKDVDATKIGLTQIKTVFGGDFPVRTQPERAREQDAERVGHNGIEIDADPMGANNPVFGAGSLPDGKQLGATALSNAPFGQTPHLDGPHRNTDYELGFHYTDASGAHARNAALHDKVERGLVPHTRVELETAALALAGEQKDTYYGSVKWGYEVDGKGASVKLPLVLGSVGAPSREFVTAASAWNDSIAGGTLRQIRGPSQLYSESGVPTVWIDWDAVMIPLGTKLSVGAIDYYGVKVASGSGAGTTGFVRGTDLRFDAKLGTHTADLPIPSVYVLDELHPRLVASPDGEGPGDRSLTMETRVQRLDEIGRRGQARVRVLDGPYAGAEGWIDASTLRDARDP